MTTILIPKVAYYNKPHQLKRFRARDKRGVSFWRKFRWNSRNQQTVDLKMDTLDANYTTTSRFILFYT